MIREHGANADREAACLNDEGRLVWVRIRRAIEALQAAPRNKPPEAVSARPRPENPEPRGNQSARKRAAR
jgi:hypothetical protein